MTMMLTVRCLPSYCLPTRQWYQSRPITYGTRGVAFRSTVSSTRYALGLAVRLDCVVGPFFEIKSILDVAQYSGKNVSARQASPIPKIRERNRG